MYPTQFQMQSPQMYGMQQPMGQQQMVQMQQAQMQPGKYKTQLCRHFKNGNCSLQGTCHFAHGVHELRQSNDPLPQNLPTVQPKVPTNNFKTVRCRYFDNGFCKNQTNCSFAHGEQDTRALSTMMPQQPQRMMPTQQNLDPNVQILIMILQNLEQVFPQNQAILQKLRLAQDYAKKSQTKEATQIILEIMENSERTPQEKQQYQTIYQNAQIYYNTYMQNDKQQGLQNAQSYPQNMQKQ